jgi:hypothetical protein
VARHVYEWTGRDVSLPSVADAFYLAEYAALIAGFLLLARGLSGGRGWLDATLLDAAVVAVAGGFLLWIVIIEPQVDDQAAGLLERCVSISYPMLDAVLLAVLVRVLMATGKVRAALVFAAVGIGFLLGPTGCTASRRSTAHTSRVAGTTPAGSSATACSAPPLSTRPCGSCPDAGCARSSSSPGGASCS